MSRWQSGIGISLLIHWWLVLWVQFSLKATLFLLKLFKILDVNFVQKCSKMPNLGWKQSSSKLLLNNGLSCQQWYSSGKIRCIRHRWYHSSVWKDRQGLFILYSLALAMVGYYVDVDAYELSCWLTDWQLTSKKETFCFCFHYLYFRMHNLQLFSVLNFPVYTYPWNQNVLQYFKLFLLRHIASRKSVFVLMILTHPCTSIVHQPWFAGWLINNLASKTP